MQYWHLDYYVCLLSAAECHGVAHQKPQIYQVMTIKQIKPIRCGKVAIDFVYKKNLADLPIDDFEGPTSYYKISSSELTAIDLLLYPERVGGINRVATILSELIDSLKAERLLALAKSTKQLSWLQRLGFILEQVIGSDGEQEHLKIIHILKKYLQQQSPRFVPLIRGEITNKPRNINWHIIVNTKIESDL